MTQENKYKTCGEQKKKIERITTKWKPEEKKKHDEWYGKKIRAVELETQVHCTLRTEKQTLFLLGSKIL